MRTLWRGSGRRCRSREKIERAHYTIDTSGAVEETIRPGPKRSPHSFSTRPGDRGLRLERGRQQRDEDLVGADEIESLPFFPRGRRATFSAGRYCLRKSKTAVEKSSSRPPWFRTSETALRKTSGRITAEPIFRNTPPPFRSRTRPQNRWKSRKEPPRSPRRRLPGACE